MINIMNKIKNFMQVKRNKTIVTIGLIIVCFFVFNLGGLLGKVFTSITSIFSSDNKEVKQVIFKSDGYDSEEDGSFKVVKQADWTSTSTAQITFTVDSIMEADIIKKDIIVVLDTSASMKGSRINSINSSLKELFETVLEDEGNKFALIEFNDTAKILTDFTDNKTTLNNLLDNITPKGETNYNQALLRVGDIMSDYTKSNDREVKVIFITDGLPNVEHPNQNATYEQLKDDYPYLKVYMFPMDISITAIEIIRISDEQDYYNTANLKESVYSPVGYETFEIVDYIDNTYFEVKDEKDIEVSIGSVSLTNENGVQKITWTVPSGEFRTGKTHTLKIDISLKDAYVKKEGLYSTNKEANIKIKLPERDLIEMTTAETPKLKNPYTVTYESNAPSGCSATIDLTETHYAYETVSFTGTKLSCDGYTFAGWKVDLLDEYYTKINSDSFIMPTQDITIKGVWTKLDINKTMGGEVYEKLTLYNTIARQAVADNIASKYVTSATGINFGAISSDTNGKGVYTIASTLNDTYPIHYFRGDVENNHVIFGGFCWEMVRTTETGGVKLIYDGTLNNGKCTNTGENSEIGKSRFSDGNYLTNSGYMYKEFNPYNNDKYIYTSITTSLLIKNEQLSGTSYYYGTSATYNTSTGTYTLGSASTKAWDSNYSSLTGYYTCLNTTTSCSTVYYILGTYSTYAYLLPLSSGKTIITETMTLGTGITDNNDGTYTLTGTTTIKKKDWYTNFANYQGYYTCSDYTSTTCTTAYSIYSPSNYQIVGNSTANNFLYGNSFTYNSSTGVYTLTDTQKYWEWYKGNPGARHYTCRNTTGSCTTIYYAPMIYSTYYNVETIPITNGKSIDDILDEYLFAEDANETDSTIKILIDEWYASNMINYTSYLEDAVWCNDRNIGSKNGFDPNNNLWMDSGLEYAGSVRTYNLLKPKIECSSLDEFTVNIKNGNGKLTYPTALITVDEVRLAGGVRWLGNTNYYLYTGQTYWTLTPHKYTVLASAMEIYDGGAVTQNDVRWIWGVRPMISLKPGITYTSGNGTEDNPYVIDLS